MLIIVVYALVGSMKISSYRKKYNVDICDEGKLKGGRFSSPDFGSGLFRCCDGPDGMGVCCFGF